MQKTTNSKVLMRVFKSHTTTSVPHGSTGQVGLFIRAPFISSETSHLVSNIYYLQPLIQPIRPMKARRNGVLHVKENADRRFPPGRNTRRHCRPQQS